MSEYRRQRTKSWPKAVAAFLEAWDEWQAAAEARVSVTERHRIWGRLHEAVDELRAVLADQQDTVRQVVTANRRIRERRRITAIEAAVAKSYVVQRRLDADGP